MGVNPLTRQGARRPAWGWVYGFVLAVSALLGAGAACAGPFAATNVDGDMLVTAEDYLADLSEEEFSPAQRAALMAQAQIRLDDHVGSGEKVHALGYVFTSPDLIVNASLFTYTSRTAAERGMRVVLESTDKSLANTPLSLHDIDGLADWYPGSRFRVLSRPDAPTLGNQFVLIDNDTVYVVSLMGAGAFAEAATVREFLAPKIERAMGFRPDIPTVYQTLAWKAGMAAGENETPDRQSIRNVITIVLLIAMTVAYWIGRGLAKLVHVVFRSGLLNATATGLLLCTGVAVAYFTWAMGHAMPAVEAIAKTDPFGAGKIRGEIIGQALFPLLIVLAVVGGRRLLARSSPVDGSARPRG